MNKLTDPDKKVMFSALETLLVASSLTPEQLSHLIGAVDAVDPGSPLSCPRLAEIDLEKEEVTGAFKSLMDILATVAGGVNSPVTTAAASKASLQFRQTKGACCCFFFLISLVRPAKLLVVLVEVFFSYINNQWSVLRQTMKPVCLVCLSVLTTYFKGAATYTAEPG